MKKQDYKTFQNSKTSLFHQNEFNEGCAADWVQGERKLNDQNEEVIVVKWQVKYEIVDKKK